MKTVKIVLGAMLVIVGIVFLATNIDKGVPVIISSGTGLLIAFLLLRSASKKKSTPANNNVSNNCETIQPRTTNEVIVDDEKVILSNGTLVEPKEWVQRFGNDRLSLTKELAKTYAIPLKEATSIAPRIYEIGQKEIDNLKLEWSFSHKINPFFEINEVEKRFAIYESYSYAGNDYRLKDVCNYDDLLSYELLEDGNSVTSGGLGGAAAGALLFGGTGAIIGGVTGKKKTEKEISSLKIKITLKGVSTAPLYINLLAIRSNSMSATYRAAYEQAQQILSTLDQITAAVGEQNNQSTPPQASAADEILKYKNLLDMGAITQEEFDAKKKELLGL